MCGICGKLQLKDQEVVNREIVDRMMAPLSHRGPDGNGTYFSGPVGLGHTRLAIIDLSGGAQPLSNEDGKVWLGERRTATLSGLHLKLLQCLMAQTGRIVSPATIVEKVYEEKYDGKSRDASIRQEILRLREKIEPDADHPRYILTERGKGYRLNVNGDQET